MRGPKREGQDPRKQWQKPNTGDVSNKKERGLIQSATEGQDEVQRESEGE